MFSYIEGNITYKSPSLLCIDINGIGYELNITLQTYSKINKLEKCRLYTHLQIREDAWVLYGFADEDERLTFRQLLNISGIGSATARIILSSLTTDELEQAIATENTDALEKIKGIGTKTAQRIVLELKGKLAKQKNNTQISALKHNTTTEDALNALVNLGINKSVAENSIRKINNAYLLTVEELIKQALRAL